MKKNKATIPDKLYDLAFEFKKEKLWKQLWDTDLFAVELGGGEIGYCCVMGQNGEHYALSLYIGQTGLDSYRSLRDDESLIWQDEEGNDMMSFQRHELLMLQNCVQCSFESRKYMRRSAADEVKAYVNARGIKLSGANSYPSFMRFAPHRFPWYLRDETDQERIAIALSAAIEVSRRLNSLMAEAPRSANRFEYAYEKLGFFNNANTGNSIPLLKKTDDGYEWSSTTLLPEKKPCYPSPVLSSADILLARAKKAKPSNADWYCDLVMMPDPTTSEELGSDDGEPVNAPYFPMMLLAFESAEWLMLPVPPAREYESDGGAELIRGFAGVVAEHGKPDTIFVRANDERTRALLSGFCAQISVKLQECGELSDEAHLLAESEFELFDHFIHNDNSPEDEIEQIFEAIAELSDEQLKQLPPDMRDILLEAARAGQMEPALRFRLLSLFS